MNKIAAIFRESMVARFFIPLGVILIVVSIFLFISDDNHKDYIKIDSTVSKVVLVKEETYDSEGNREEAEYDIYVKYTVDEQEYEEKLGQMYERKIGDKIKIVYNPSNPRDIAQPASPILNIIILIGGIVSLVGGIISAIGAVKRFNKMREQEASWN